MLLEMAVGDAFGIGFEFVKPEDMPLDIDLDRYTQNPRYPECRAGFYTDDTHRALSNARVILEKDPTSIRSYVETYLEDFENDSRKGFSKGYQAFLEEGHTVGSFMNNIRRDRATNGAIMGVLPLGYLPTTGEVKAAAAAQVLATHSHEAIPYAQDLALRAHRLIYGGGMVEAEWPKGRGFRTAHHGRVSMEAHDTWAAAITIFKSHRSYSKMLRDVVTRGGDTDSVAAIVMGLASIGHCADDSLVNDLHPNLFRYLEGGKTHPLIEMDHRLKDYSKKK